MNSRGPMMPCPHCGKACTVRTSEQLSPLYREAVYQCRNLICGHVFVAGIEPVRTLSPSAIPNPEIHIPLASSVRRREIASQMSLPLEGSKP